MGKKICLLEDDAGIREVIEMILTDEQYEVYGFASVKDFLSRKEEELPDLYLLDVMLPDGNGLEVCNLLKESEKTKKVPVLIMSAHASLNEMQNQCKAEDFITKPFDIFELIKRVDLQVKGPHA